MSVAKRLKTIMLIEKLMRERQELDKKITKLTIWTRKVPINSNISTQMWSLLIKQKDAMIEYDNILVQRIELLKKSIR